MFAFAVGAWAQEEGGGSGEVAVESAAEVVFATDTLKPAEDVPPEPTEISIVETGETGAATETVEIPVPEIVVEDELIAEETEILISGEDEAEEAATGTAGATGTVAPPAVPPAPAAPSAVPSEESAGEEKEEETDSGVGAPPSVPVGETPQLEPEEDEPGEVAVEAAAEIDFSTQPAEAATEPVPVVEEIVLAPLVTISNDFIHLEVNPGPNEAGRFSIETVRGDPTVDTDDKKILIYGRPRPWT
ncbi:MAG: hypothetical protein ABIH66_02480, partial [bacterium]